MTLGHNIVRAEPGEDLPTHMHLAHLVIEALASGLSLTSHTLHARGHPHLAFASADVDKGCQLLCYDHADFSSPRSPTRIHIRTT